MADDDFGGDKPAIVKQGGLLEDATTRMAQAIYAHLSRIEALNAGRPWGGDEAGEKFAADYEKIAHTSIDNGRSLADIATGAGTTAVSIGKGYIDTDEAVKIINTLLRR